LFFLIFTHCQKEMVLEPKQAEDNSHQKLYIRDKFNQCRLRSKIILYGMFIRVVNDITPENH